MGASMIRPNACAKLFLSAASRKMLITKENINMNMKEGAEEHTRLSKLRSALLQKERPVLIPPQIFVPIVLKENFIYRIYLRKT